MNAVKSLFRIGFCRPSAQSVPTSGTQALPKPRDPDLPRLNRYRTVNEPSSRLHSPLPDNLLLFRPICAPSPKDAAADSGTPLRFFAPSSVRSAPVAPPAKASEDETCAKTVRNTQARTVLVRYFLLPTTRDGRCSGSTCAADPIGFA